ASTVEFYINTSVVGTNTSGVNGYYKYNWDPDNNLNPGIYVFYANARDVQYYHNYTDTVPNSTITVWGKLNITSFGFTDKEIYRIGESTVLSVNVSDENDVAVNNAIVSFVRDSSIINVTNTTNGYASYTYDPSDTITPNNYTMYVNVSKQYYYNDSKQDWLLIKGKINLTIISPNTGQKFYRNNTVQLNSNVTDENNVEVSPDWSEWKKIFPTQEVISNQPDYDWNIPYNYPKGLLSIQFNATKMYYDIVGAIPSVDITIWSKANVTILNSPQDLNRGNNITIVARVSDHFTNENLGGYDIGWFVNDVNIANYTTAPDGTSSYYWITNCSYDVGVNWINATIGNDTSNYIDANIANSKIDIHLIGNLSTSIISPHLDSLYHINDVIQLNSSTIDDCNNYVIPVVTWRNETDVIQSGINATWTIPLTYNKGPTNITIYANKSYYYNATNSTRIIIYRWVNITDLNPINVTYPVGTIINFTCFVRDANLSLGIENYPVNFYKNGVLQNVSYTNTSGLALWIWNTTNELSNNYTIKCNITDNATLYLNKSHPYEQQGNITIERRLWIINISVDNRTIYRNDTWAILNNLPYATNITVEVWDAAINPASNVIVHFFNSTNEMGNCTTNSDGKCSVIFNPPDTIIVQNYTILINATKIGNDPSFTENTTIEILGVLRINASNYPTGLDVNYENETIEATIEHDILITDVILNITLPNSTVISSQMQSMGNNNYVLNYTPKINGTHSYFVYAIDASNFLNQSSTAYFTAYRNTTLSTKHAPQLITITNMTYFNTQQLQVSLNVTNLGPSSAYYTNLSVQTPSGWISNYNGNCGLIKDGESCLRTVDITVPSNTSPGIYYLNSNTTWMNPDNTYSYITNVTTVNVTSNPLLNISQNSIGVVVQHNSYNITIFTVQSIGNDNLSNIQFDCYTGIVCTNFSVSFSPSSISFLGRGNSQDVNVNVSVPLGFAMGNYTGIIRANATSSVCNPSSNCWDEVEINIEVPPSSTWYAEEKNFSLARVNTSSTGFIGNITINNTGNTPIQFTWEAYGNISYMLIGENITVENQTVKNMTISYSIPHTLNDTNNTPAFYAGGIRIIAINGVPQSMNFSVNFSVYDTFAPNINNFSLDSNFIDINYGVLGITANVTDNVKVQSVYVEFSRPGKKFSNLMTNVYDDIYYYSCKADGSCIDALGIWNIKISTFDTANNPENPPPGYNVNSSGYLQVEVVGNTSVDILTIPVINVSNITQGYVYEFNITPIFNNTFKGTAFYSNLSLNISYPLTIDNVSTKTINFGNVSRYSAVNQTLLVKIPSGTVPGTYLINYNASWMNADNTHNSNINQTTINVLSNPLLNIVEDYILTTIAHGSSNATTFNLSSYGNDNLSNIEITCVSGTVCTNPCFDVLFDKNYLNLSAGNSSIVTVSVNVGLGCSPGNYTGIIRANATSSVCNPSSNCWDEVEINVSVLTSPTWGITPNYLSQIVYDNSSGNLIDILVNNTGNVQINLSITLSGNATTPTQLINVTETDVSVDKVSTKNVTVTYDIPNNQIPGIYQAIITFTNTSSPANPTQVNVTIYIDVRDPYSPTISNPNLSKTALEANFESLTINATITDNVAISEAWVNITLPNMSNNIIFMNNIGDNLYSTTYKPPIGGSYGVTIYANDTSNNIASMYAGSFNVIGKTTGNLKQTPTSISFNNITYLQGAQFDVHLNITNVGNTTMRYLNLTVLVPQDEYDCENGKCKWNFTCSGLNCNGSGISCGNLTINESCDGNFTIFVPKGTSGGTTNNIFGAAFWLDPDLTIGNTTNYTSVTVASNPVINVTPLVVSNSIEQGKISVLGSINISSYGNSPLYTMNYTSVGGNLPYAWLSFAPEIVNIPVGVRRNLDISVSVPFGQNPGIYNTTLIVNATGSAPFCDPSSSYYNPNSKCWEFVNLSLNVPENWSWSRYPSSDYIIVPITTSGQINITVNNTGNMDINFEVQYSGDTSILDPFRPTSLFSPKQSSNLLQVGYNGTISGLYNVLIKLVNLSIPSPYPKEQTTNITLNVTNVPPNIQNVSIAPSILDVNYQKVNISAVVTHPASSVYVWANITKPDNSITTIPMSGVGNTYSATYTPEQEGMYGVTIYANESRDGLMSSSGIYNFLAFATTSLELISIPNETAVYKITQYDGNITNLNITVRNTGMATAYNTVVSLQAPQGWTLIPTMINYGNITRNSANSTIVTITIPKGTPPGNYYVNLNLSWMNPNNVVSTVTSNVRFEVAQNPFANFTTKEASSVTLDGYSNYTILTLNSTGNIDATDISISCVSGPCSNLSTTISPPFISYLAIGNTRDINISFSVPVGYPAGTHVIGINAFTPINSDAANISITVPPNYSWNRTPSSIFARVGVSENYTTTEIGRIEVDNLGNIEMFFNITIDNSTYIYPNVTVLQVPRQSKGVVGVRTVVPSERGTHNATITIINNLTKEEMNTTVNLEVTELRVNVISPISNELRPVKLNDTLEVFANVTYQGVPLTDGVNWTIELSNAIYGITKQCDVNNATYQTDRWRITCIIPETRDATLYDLVVSAYAYDPSINTISSSTRTNAIFYEDITPPKFVGVNISSVQPNEIAVIKVNVTDNVAVSDAWVEIMYPNYSTTSANLTYIENLWQMSFNDTSQIGDYELKIYAKDNSNNLNQTYSWFGSYYPMRFYGEAKDVAGNPYYIEFNFYRPGKTDLLFNVTSKQTGIYDKNISARLYDIEVKAFGNKIKLYGTNLTKFNNSGLYS
ncbi:MAG: NEW3 domain-containing protein, partial [Candidatus Nanoarchaeia archaeon]|nr:NEW3 domain-containing protein [Candidatus Jingweiarchaeum tengchongense]